MTPSLGPARRCLVLLALATLLACVTSVPAQAQSTGADKARISGLADVSFGTITSFAGDAVRVQSICVYAKAPPADTYSITALGSGSGGQFQLAAGPDTLPYEVQFASLSGQTTGVQLSPGVPLVGQANSARDGDCSKGPATTATLIVILRSSALAAAMAGSYSGSLSLLVAPE